MRDVRQTGGFLGWGLREEIQGMTDLVYMASCQGGDNVHELCVHECSYDGGCTVNILKLTESHTWKMVNLLVCKLYINKVIS